ncbi:Orf y [Tanacetum coccineum]
MCSLENQTNPYAGTSEVTNSVGTLQTPNANASEEEDETEELIVVPTVAKHTATKVRPRKSSTNSKGRGVFDKTSKPKTQEKTPNGDIGDGVAKDEKRMNVCLFSFSEAYSDSDYAGANLDRKSTTGGCQFLGRRLISWQYKKQTIVATTTTEAKYVAVASCCGQGQSHLVDTDTESRPIEDLRETKIPQPLPSAPSLEAPLETEEFEASEPSDTRITSPHSTAPSDSTTPLSPNHPLAQTSPALTRASYYRTYGRAYSADLIPGHVSLNSGGNCFIFLFISTLRMRVRIWILRDRVQRTGVSVKSMKVLQAVPVVDTAADEPLDLGYGALRHRELAIREGSVPSTFEIGQISRSVSKQQRVEETPTLRSRVRATWVDPVDGIVYTYFLVNVPPVRVPVQTPHSPEWSSGSLLVSPSSPTVPTPVASPVTTPAATISVGEDELLEGYDMDLRELYTRSRKVRDEIFSQRYRLRSLKQEQERATVTFGAIWRPVLALES